MPARRVTPRGMFRVIQRIADGRVGAVERAFLREVQRARAAIDLRQLEQAVAEIASSVGAQKLLTGRAVVTTEMVRRVFDAMNLWDLDSGLARSVTAAIAPTVRAAGLATAQMSPVSLGVGMRFDFTHPRATRFAATQSSRLVREVSRATRAAIRREIATGFREQRTVAKTAQALRSVVGLTERQAAAVSRLREGLAARIEADLPPLGWQAERLARVRARMPASVEAVDAVADRYSARLLRDRAEAIARTETIRASAGGQVETWRQNAEEGLIDVAVARKIWVYTKDSRTECSCLSIPELNPDGVPLDEPFLMRDCRTNELRHVYLPGDSHPLCRCALGMVFHVAESRHAA